MSQPDTRTRIAPWTWKKTGVGVLLVALVLWMSLANLESVPPLWWDEGWTLSVARNWVELGHYGQLLNGQPRSAGLSAAFPVVAPIALSFRLFGVGIWQGRLVGVLYMFASLALIYCLARRLYSRPVAVATLGVLLLMPVSERLHPILIGREALGEMPAIFYLLTGYLCLFLALRGRAWLLVLAMLAWGIAVRAKGEVPPFWLVSLLLPLAVALLKRWWKQAILLALGLAGSLVVAELVVLLQGLILHGTSPVAPVAGLYEVTALVLDLNVRVGALLIPLTFGLPTALGICVAAWQSFRLLRRRVPDINLEIVRLALLGLTGSWLAWYVLLSISWPRYVFPALFVGGPFASALLYNLTDRFDLPATVRNANSMILGRHLNRVTGGALLAVILIALMIGGGAQVSALSLTTLADSSVVQVARFFDTQTAPDALIESYESELFFLVHRRYHYPPDDIHVQLNRRNWLNPDTPVDYDPLAADPDYLVVGPAGEEGRLYDPVLATGAFRPLFTTPRYKVYERVR
jgi:4-amino-4-deoxy-L-arabinose transferase-like glycosyltransferase